MKLQIQQTWQELSSSYWFLPAVMALGSILLASISMWIDETVGGTMMLRMPWVQFNSVAGARTVLSTIAGSMIGVAGVTFSITVASVVNAAGQYGPRLLSNFMSDRGNQVTLGTFVATFVFCLLILRTIRAEGSDQIAHVPQLSIALAVGLSLASIAVFIYFLNHAPSILHISRVIASLGDELTDRIDATFPALDFKGAEGKSPGERPILIETAREGGQPLLAPRSGYIQAINRDGLVLAARQLDGWLKVHRRPGDFVARGDALATAYRIKVEPGPLLDRALEDCFMLGRIRTELQDPLFVLSQLCEVAVRALSPGVNDPRTAMDCLDWMVSGLKHLLTRDLSERPLIDSEGTVRGRVQPITFDDFLHQSFGHMRPYVAADPNASMHALRLLSQLQPRAIDPGQRLAIGQTASALLQTCKDSIRSEYSLAGILQCYDELMGKSKNKEAEIEDEPASR